MLNDICRCFCSGVVVLLAAVARECTFEKHVFVWRVLHFSNVGRLGAERKREGFLKKADGKSCQNATNNTRANASEKASEINPHMFEKCYQNSSRRLPGTPWGPPARKLRPRTRPRPPLGPSGPPKTNFGSAPSAPRAPQRGQQGLRTPPRGGQKCSKMQQAFLRPRLLGPRGAPRAAGEASGSNLTMISSLPGLCFSNVRAFVSGVRKEQNRRRH